MTGWAARRCVVIGSTGGIGAAFVNHLCNRQGVEQIYAFSRRTTGAEAGPKLHNGVLDYRDPGSIQKAAEMVAQGGPVDLVIVATGLLHGEDGFAPEKSLRQLDADKLLRAYLVNAVGPSLVAKEFLPLMNKDQKSVFAALSARVGSISDNHIGGWYGYRAAKAGLNQLLRTASIEHARKWPFGVVVGLHPGTVDSQLSKPFQRNVAPGKLFSATDSTARMLSVLEGLDSQDSGGVFAYDGTRVPA